MDKYSHMPTCIYAHIYAWHTHIHTCTHTHKHTHTHIQITHICTCTHMYMHTQPGPDVQKYFFLALQKQAFMGGKNRQVERTNHKLGSWQRTRRG